MSEKRKRYTMDNDLILKSNKNRPIIMTTDQTFCGFIPHKMCNTLKLRILCVASSFKVFSKSFYPKDKTFHFSIRTTIFKYFVLITISQTEI